MLQTLNMSDSLYELLTPHNVSESAGNSDFPTATDAVTSKYLARLPKLDLAALKNSESQSLAQSSHSTLLALQALSSRSTKALISSSDHLGNLSKSIPLVEKYGQEIRSGVSELDSQAVAFSTKYSRGGDSPSELLERRKRALLLARNIDRVGDILELPTLLSSAVNSAAAGSTGSTSSTTSSGAASASAAATSATYNAALDLHGHVRRLATLHPDSALVARMTEDATAAMKEMTTSLIQTLRGTNLKLAGGMRTVGWLRRVVPELNAANSSDDDAKGMPISVGGGDEEGGFGALFLVCRLANLHTTLEALEPLKDLADQETAERKANGKKKGEGGGHQTERYLKKFIELFREQSFGIISMFRSIFPAEEDTSVDDLGFDLDKISLSKTGSGSKRPKTEPLPSALATFPLHLIEHVLLPTLQEYLPNVGDKSVRESLMTQVLYCAGSLGRLGADFSVLLTALYESTESETSADNGSEGLLEWVDVVKKHRVQAARLESLAATSSSRVKASA